MGSVPPVTDTIGAIKAHAESLDAVLELPKAALDEIQRGRITSSVLQWYLMKPPAERINRGKSRSLGCQKYDHFLCSSLGLAKL